MAEKNKRPKSFLIINPYGIGDVLFSTPLVRVIAEAIPGAEIYYLCNRRSADVIRNNPLIKKVFVYERDEFEVLKKKSVLQWIKAWWQFIAEIRSERIEVAVDLSLNWLFGFCSWMAAIPVRTGLDYKKRGRFLTHRVAIAGFDDRHVSDYYMQPLACLGIKPESRCMEVFVDDENRKWVCRVCAERDIPDTATVIGVAPCGGEAFGKEAYRKRWPEEKYAQLIAVLLSDVKKHIFIFAGPKEKTEIERMMALIPQKARCHVFTDTTLFQLIALINRCDLFISNDTGPMRIADALQKKIVSFFGPADERVYGLYPYDPCRHRYLIGSVSCRPCYRQFRLPPCTRDRECLTAITPEIAYNAVIQLLNK